MPPPTLLALLRGQLQLHMTTTPLFQMAAPRLICPYKDQFFDSVLELLLEHRVSR
jgi:hypothetical protein